MKLIVYGRIIEAVRANGKWSVYYLGNDGKKRLADDIVIPSETNKEDIVRYLADLCHEWAKPNASHVSLLD